MILKQTYRINTQKSLWIKTREMLCQNCIVSPHKVPGGIVNSRCLSSSSHLSGTRSRGIEPRCNVKLSCLLGSGESKYVCVDMRFRSAPNHGKSFMPSPGCQNPWQNEAKLKHANTAIKRACLLAAVLMPAKPTCRLVCFEPSCSRINQITSGSTR